MVLDVGALARRFFGRCLFPFRGAISRHFYKYLRNSTQKKSLTPEQIIGLDWTLNLNVELVNYWNGETPFQSIEELVAHLKENSPRLFTLSPTKRAVSTTTAADNASQ